jgi:AhpD family alkylhydroperoxidase
MSRIEGVTDKQAGPLVRVIYRLVRREISKITGQPGRLTGDIPIRAHRPRMLIGYGMLEKAFASKPTVEPRLRALAVLKSAVMQGCEMCQDIGSHEARAAGISEQQLIDLYRYRDSEHFDLRERLVLDLAAAMTVTPVQVDDELFAALSEHFDDGQLVELANLVALENLRSRFNAAFAIGSTGFSDGMVCARMEPATAIAGSARSATAEDAVSAPGGKDPSHASQDPSHASQSLAGIAGGA